MKKFLLVYLLLIFPLFGTFCQLSSRPSYIKDMEWGTDNIIRMTMFNDSTYTVRIEDIYHSTSASDSSKKEFVYYPVMLARDFVDKLKDVKIDTSAHQSSDQTVIPMTLWNSLHSSIGGGWVHFVNCLLYSFESHYISLTAPLMKRPKTSWKPEVMTEKYKRSRKWDYYVPVDQKQAQKEYYLKVKENTLDLHDVPKDFIDLFLQTNNKEYRQIIASGNAKKQARIDLVKLLLATDYLSEPQIKYIKNMVQKAILQYSYNQLPTVIVFDDLQAAVVMSLNESGYKLEKIVFRNNKYLNEEDISERRGKIEQTIVAINKVNQKVFEARLKKYFGRKSSL